ncbi:MAG: PDZ domain-containing protein [Alphaproteobacteria bacterium]|nr:PDZ domain-containing protein [Alphaproteobacteria bacterium]
MKTKAIFTICLCVLLSKVTVAQQLVSFADLVETLQPSVINISTTLLPSDMENDDNLGIISPNPQINNYFSPQNSQNTSLGSGFIIDEEGYAITNNHVIDKAQKIIATTNDNNIFEASVIGVDEKTDLALIKLSSAQKFPVAKLGNSDEIRVGDQIITIGNPFGLGGSVSTGIISAKARDIEAGLYDNFIQTDASINQGSSGGPMFNMNGEVIGINSAIYSTNGGNIGIGFATPINLAKFVINQLKTKGKVERGWLGIKIRLQTDANGIVVSSISTSSPAEKANIEAGDIITELNGNKITSPKEFSRKIAETQPNSIIELKIMRNGLKFNKKLKLEIMPEINQNIAPNPQNTFNKNYFAGLDVIEVTDNNKQENNISTSSFGVIVADVLPTSDAASKGIKKGDFITEVDRRPIVTKQDFVNFVSDAVKENNRYFVLTINNNNNPMLVSVKP